jgi:SPP1 family predicted phage head-tail adaptor
MSRVEIGTMRHRVVIEESVSAPDGGGGAIVTWTPVAEVWAAITPRAGRETAEADGLMGRVTHAITIRHRGDVTPRQRFRKGDRIFDITSVIDADEAHRFLTCLVEERLG